jgi:hypothetical protein
MLTTNHFNLHTRWEGLQQPVHGSARRADTLRLLAALDEGWQIRATAETRTHDRQDERHGYRLTLVHPRRAQTLELNLHASPEVQALLNHETGQPLSGRC